MAQRQKGIRDHARNRSQPNIDNKVISQQERKFGQTVCLQLVSLLSFTRNERTNFEFAFDASSGVDTSLAASAVN